MNLGFYIKWMLLKKTSIPKRFTLIGVVTPMKKPHACAVRLAAMLTILKNIIRFVSMGCAVNQ